MYASAPEITLNTPFGCAFLMKPATPAAAIVHHQWIEEVISFPWSHRSPAEKVYGLHTSRRCSGLLDWSSWSLVVAVVVCGWYKKYFLRKKPRTCHSEQRQKRHPIMDRGARARVSNIMLHSLERERYVTPQSKGGGIYSMIWIGGGCACHVNFSILRGEGTCGIPYTSCLGTLPKPLQSYSS